MKKILLNIIIGLIIIGGATTGNVAAQDPPIKVSLALVQSPLTGTISYLLNDPNMQGTPEPIHMALSLTNNNSADILTSKGFSNLPFHLYLTFIDPDGKGIASKYLESSTGGEPPPPSIISVNGQLLQVEPIETLQGTLHSPNWKLSKDIPDAHAYYSLTKAGRYSVRAMIPMRTYLSIDHSVSGVDYSEIDRFQWQGAIESNPVEFALLADADGDGYYYPEPYGQHAEPDCNDSNPNINPGMTEIQGNGIDDDCNPLTSDGVVTIVNVLNPNGGEVIPSGSTYSIRWAAPSNAVKFDLQYSMNNGTTWTAIASKITSTSYSWTVPKPLKNKKNCLVKVIGYDASNVKVGEGTSDSTFTIEVIKVTSPNGQEIWKAGTIHAITWKTNGTKRPVKKVKLFYTYNGGTNWILIYTLLRDNPGSYSWSVLPSANSANCKVKVILKDAYGNTIGTDVSDEVFTIQP